MAILSRCFPRGEEAATQWVTLHARGPGATEKPCPWWADGLIATAPASSCAELGAVVDLVAGAAEDLVGFGKEQARAKRALDPNDPDRRR